MCVSGVGGGVGGVFGEPMLKRVRSLLKGYTRVRNTNDCHAALLAAVLLRAMLDLRSHGVGGGGGTPRRAYQARNRLKTANSVREDAREWFLYKGGKRRRKGVVGFSFRGICEYFGVDPEVILDKLRREGLLSGKRGKEGKLALDGRRTPGTADAVRGGGVDVAGRDGKAGGAGVLG